MSINIEPDSIIINLPCPTCGALGTYIESCTENKAEFKCACGFSWCSTYPEDITEFKLFGVLRKLGNRVSELEEENKILKSKMCPFDICIVYAKETNCESVIANPKKVKNESM